MREGPLSLPPFCVSICYTHTDAQCASDISISSANNHLSHKDTHTTANASSLVSHVCVNQIRALHHYNQPHVRWCQNQLHHSLNML